jgi:hypothetical protein
MEIALNTTMLTPSTRVLGCLAFIEKLSGSSAEPGSAGLSGIELARICPGSYLTRPAS